MISKDEALIVKFSLFYKTFIISLCLFTGHFLKDYDVSARREHVANGICDRASNFLIPLSTRWDAVYFLNIAKNGYSFEQEFAFFPGFPFLIRQGGLSIFTASNFVKSIFNQNQDARTFYFTDLDPVCQDLSFQLAALAVSNISSILAVLMLYRLSISLSFREKSAKLAAMLFSISPASIFLSSAYTEAPFALFTLAGMLSYSKGRNFEASLFWCVATSIRSNGIVFVGFFLWQLISPLSLSFWKVFKTAIYSGIVVAPFVLFQWYGYNQFCVGGGDHIRPWCMRTIIYSFVQDHYWNNGLFRYWTLQQLPNFLLAAPVVGLHTLALVDYISKDPYRFLSLGYIKKKTKFANEFSRANLLPYMYLMAVLLMYVCFFMHIQVIIRFFTWQPLGYLYAATKLNSKISSRIGKLYFYYSLLYGITGSILFSQFLPPA